MAEQKLIDNALSLRDKADYSRGINVYGLLDASGKQITKDGHRSCHGYLLYNTEGYGYNNTPGSILFSAWHYGLNAQSGGEYDEPSTQAFIKWLFLESPWGKVVGAADWYGYVTDKGYIIGDLEDKPGNAIYGFCIASRVPFEYAPACRAWYWLVSAGVDPALAFQALCRVNGERYMVIDSAHGPNHSITGCGEKYLRNFMEGKVARATPPGIPKFGVNDLWGYRPAKTTLQETWAQLYPQFCGERTTSDIWGGKLTIKTFEPTIDMLLCEQERLKRKRT